jgi:hypothetical protein
VKGAFERLEPDEVKVSSPVLRGRGGGNAASLPDHPTSLAVTPTAPGAGAPDASAAPA